MLAFVITQKEWKELQQRVQIIEKQVDALQTGINEIFAQFADMAKTGKEVTAEMERCKGEALDELAKKLEQAMQSSNWRSLKKSRRKKE